MPRATRLKYQGDWIERYDDVGNVVISGPTMSFPGIPARDLDEDDIKALDDEQYRNAVDSGLYLNPDAKRSAAKSAPSAEEVSAEQIEHVAEAGAGGGEAQ